MNMMTLHHVYLRLHFWN